VKTPNIDIQKLASIELAKRDLWHYENYLYPKFYKEDRGFLKELANTLQLLYENKLLKPDGSPYRKLIINMPPRHGKSFSLVNFTSWLLGKNQEEKIFTVSYNETLSGRFSKNVRDTIEVSQGDQPTFKDIFPDVGIKRGDGAAQLWALNGQHFNYLGSSPSGTLTGMGCTIGIIDDLIKSKEEAFNDTVLEKHYDFYTNTFLSRLEEGSRQIICATRWNKNDLTGRLLDLEPDDWYVLKMPVEVSGNMLCDEILSYDTFKDKTKGMIEEIVQANYYNEPIDVQGKLYTSFKTYDKLPENGIVKAYIDTADQGSDYLCCVIYHEINLMAYVVDVLYTKQSMEFTEPETAKSLIKNNVTVAMIESNNGGRSFARNVQRIINENRAIINIKWFHQSQNKTARIISNSGNVMNNVVFPSDWRYRWPEYYKAMDSYQKEGKNKNDDAPDATTGIIEFMQSGRKIKKR